MTKIHELKDLIDNIFLRDEDGKLYLKIFLVSKFEFCTFWLG